MAATDVSFSGKYNDGMDVSAGVSGTTYDYVKSDGTTATGVAYDADPVLTDFTYKDVDGSSKSLQDGTPDISEYVGTTTASGDIVSTQTIAAGETAVRDNYTYVSGAGETVMLGESAQDMVATHTLSGSFIANCCFNIFGAILWVRSFFISILYGRGLRILVGIAYSLFFLLIFLVFIIIPDARSIIDIRRIPIRLLNLCDISLIFSTDSLSR